MSQYRFEFREDYADETVDGVELESDAAAQAEAIAAAREFMTDGIRKGIDRTGWISRVFDENGRLVVTVKFSDLLEKRGSLQ